jgi:cell division protein ZapA (FtsZ GTPase activity inhibitor)
MDAADKAKQQHVRVNIFNQPYTVVAAGDPKDTIELAHEVDELMSQIARYAGNLDATRTAVLACLHFADRLRTIERQLTTLRESVDHRTRTITELLDQVIPEELD